jgi:hypothetical protein
MTELDLDAHARALMDANLYVTLGTVDAQGTPWVSPVCFATADYAELLWVSRRDAQHSRNLAMRPQLSGVIFDSTVPAYHGRAVYLSGTAAELTGRELDRGVEIFRVDPNRGGTTVSVEDVSAPSEYRLYRAAVSEAFVLCPRGPRQPAMPPARHRGRPPRAGCALAPPGLMPTGAPTPVRMRSPDLVSSCIVHRWVHYRRRWTRRSSRWRTPSDGVFSSAWAAVRRR